MQKIGAETRNFVQLTQVPRRWLVLILKHKQLVLQAEDLSSPHVARMDIYPAIVRFYAGLTLSLLLGLPLLSAPSITGVHSLAQLGALREHFQFAQLWGGHLRTEMTMMRIPLRLSGVQSLFWRQLDTKLVKILALDKKDGVTWAPQSFLAPAIDLCC
ncbi:hypothetical protein B0H17DRAFT_1155317 [Mycena rosella]|uniref:Uncharacterized protein n=1 Tax=Mycena rosella TaxID=1033263 RepID=A0AAD7AWV7_MYCRO|nr:hypothetical protein B0H17DRAFT_1155317 [Mycena rosella]